MITQLATSAIEYNAFLETDGRTLWFSSLGRPTNVGLTDLWVATRPDRVSAFEPPRLVTELNTPAEEASLTMIATGRVAVFTSNRPGSVGRLDLWYTTRASTAEPFGTPLLVPGINTAVSDYTGFLREDGCELIFTSTRGGTGTGEDLYISQLIP